MQTSGPPNTPSTPQTWASTVQTPPLFFRDAIVRKEGGEALTALYNQVRNRLAACWRRADLLPTLGRSMVTCKRTARHRGGDEGQMTEHTLWRCNLAGKTALQTRRLLCSRPSERRWPRESLAVKPCDMVGHQAGGDPCHWRRTQASSVLPALLLKLRQSSGPSRTLQVCSEAMP